MKSIATILEDSKKEEVRVLCEIGLQLVIVRGTKVLIIQCNIVQMSAVFNVSFLYIFHVSAYRQVCVLCTNKMQFHHYICTTRVIRAT